MEMLPNMGPAYTKAFTGVYPEIALKHRIHFIPFFLEGVAGNRLYNQLDQIHPNAKGYTRVVEHIYPHIVTVIKK